MRIEETVIVKALRTHANEVLEVRMLVDGSSSSWQAKDRGLYEVRRKDWEDMPQHSSRGYTRDDWERRTVYLVPPHPLPHSQVPRSTLMYLCLFRKIFQ